MELGQKSSTKSLIRKRLHESIGASSHTDESLENLDKARKIVTILYSSPKQVSIKSCKKSQIFVFDTSNSITI